LEIDHCEFPDDIYLDVDNDVWLRISKDSAKMGVTSILSFLAGKLTSVKFRKANGGGLVTSQQTIATIESGKFFGPVRTPVSGKIARFNTELQREPRLINKSPYGEWWIAEFEMLNQDQLSALKKSTDARDAIQSRIRELKIRCFKALPDDEMFSIGSECSTTLANLNQLLEKAPRGTVVHLVTDDPTADIEMIRWSDQTKNRVLETRREGNLYHFIIEKTGSI
jgi:glycine cleavage system H protein